MSIRLKSHPINVGHCQDGMRVLRHGSLVKPFVASFMVVYERSISQSVQTTTPHLPDLLASRNYP